MAGRITGSATQAADVKHPAQAGSLGLSMEFLKQTGTILIASVLIGLSIIFLGVGSADVDGIAPRPAPYRLHLPY